MKKIALVSTLLLAACGGSGSSSDEGIPPLPAANGEPIDVRYQPLGEDASIILDVQTQLAWQRCPKGMSWSNATSQCDGQAELLSWENANGFSQTHVLETGFRLPTAEELATLIYCSDRHVSAELIGSDTLTQSCGASAQSPAIKTVVFPAVEQRTYWSSSATPGSETKRGINFALGAVSNSNSVLSEYPVLLVREAEPQ
ncbi:hypothetical protein CHH28_01930 [Bacterioplanes sanyensis]|uniref:Lcl C-terminal domain-containing protein n=1 Tax=Bacterioplanes sanyensis TaxID=1249553 RepID=A0A222FFZ4_9GAMM|nr:DUF1566 domain-containing protein [Bacterioplanes sanyensis]ASP37506.1 hypothetical protein CHH28_01930 [Bacterioplanes sanyensis]